MGVAKLGLGVADLGRGGGQSVREFGGSAILAPESATC